MRTPLDPTVFVTNNGRIGPLGGTGSQEATQANEGIDRSSERISQSFILLEVLG